MIVLTPEMIEQLRTPQGGFNQRTMELIGAWPLREGWMGRLVGTKIGDRRWKAALRQVQIKTHYFRGNTRRRH